jgi:two-component system invasion response regulator UvrY
MPDKSPIRIILVDDHKLAREAWKMLLGYEPTLDVIAECSNGEDAIARARELKPDIMLVDINMTPVNGFQVTQRVLADNPDAKIIGISVNNHPSYANRMIEFGAKGFVTKGSPFNEIVHAIEEVHKGEIYLCKEILVRSNF